MSYLTPTPDANQRARELLPRILSPGERKMWEKTRKIQITGSEGGVYTINTSCAVGNVRPHQSVRVGVFGGTAYEGSGLCAHMQGGYWNRDRTVYHETPLWDQFIAQILMIKADEKKFLRIANRYY